MAEDLKYWRDKGFEMSSDGKLVKIKGTKDEKVKKKGKSKYRNRKKEVDGITFDSEKEAKMYATYKLLKRSGEIKSFERQVKMPITINNKHIANYFLDFKVEYSDGRIEYIDVKAKDKETQKWITTDVFQLKKKLVQAIYGIEIKLV